MNIKFNSIVLYLCIAGLVIYTKPNFMFSKSHSIKKFGIGKDETICTFPICMILFSILIYLLLTIINYK